MSDAPSLTRYTFDDAQAELLLVILDRAIETFGFSTKLENMASFWKELRDRLRAGEREFDLAGNERRYLRKACMGARRVLNDRLNTAGFFTRSAIRKRLDAHASLFDLVLSD